MANLDLKLVLATSTILAFGILIHYSVAPESLNSHVLFVALGLIGALAAYKFDVRVLTYFYYHLYGLACLLLVITLGLGAATRGATRWIDLGLFRFQPSEFAKPLIILFLAELMTRLEVTTLKGLLKAMGLALVPTILVFLQPDLGSAIVIGVITATMIFASGMRLRHLAMLAAVAALLTPLGWLSLKDYQKARVHSFLDPSSDPLGKGYNSIQSIIAVGSGQISGLGLGHGTQSKLNFLPESQTDFIFASLAEELGLMGSSILIGAYTLLIWQLFALAKQADSPFSFNVLIGVVAAFSTQIIINIGMNIGLLPITGITLPLVSYGGSSMITNLILLGIALNLSKTRAKPSGIEISASGD